MPTWRAIAAAVRRVVAGDHHQSTAQVRAARRWPAPSRALMVSATARTPAGWPVDRGEDRASCLRPRSRSAPRLAAASVSMPASASSRALPTRTWRPSTVARTPLPVIGVEPGRPAAGRGRARRAPATIAVGQGVLAVPLRRGHQRAAASSRESRRRVTTSVRAGLPRGDGAGLVEHDGVQLVRGLQRFGGADEDAGLGALAGRDHDRQRGREAERARAGDDQHRHRSDQREGERGRGPGDEPDGEGGDRDGDDGGHEVAGDRVGQALDRRLGGLGLLHHADDLGQHRVGADLGGRDPQAIRCC